MRRLLSVIALGCASFALFECVGEDPDSTPSSPDAASTTDGAASADSSTPTSDSGGPLDAGSDSAIAEPCDAAAPTSAAGTVQCIDAGCTGGGQCCYTGTTSGTTGCLTPAAVCPALQFRCDKASDCDAGLRCCLSGTASTSGECPYSVTNTTGAACAASCSAGTIQLCTSQENCVDGTKRCVPIVATVNANAKTYTRTLGACL